MTPEQEELYRTHEYLVDGRLKALGYWSHPEADEMKDEGLLALAEATVTFRSELGASFRYYAINKIEWAIKDYFRKIDTMARGQRESYKARGILRQVAMPERSSPLREFHNRMMRRARIMKMNQDDNYRLDMNAIRKGCMMAGCV